MKTEARDTLSKVEEKTSDAADGPEQRKQVKGTV